MKKLIFLVALLALVVFVSGSMAQQKQTPAPAKPVTTPAPVPAPPEKPKLEKFSSTIEKVDEVAKTLEVKQKVKKEEKTLAFAIDDKTKITKGKGTISLGDLKKGMRVSIEYKKDGDKNVAVAVKVVVPKTRPKKPEEKPAEPEKK